MPIQENETVKQSNKDRLKDITDSIEKGIKELFESDKSSMPISRKNSLKQRCAKAQKGTCNGSVYL